ncbi:hypothetical protein SynMITS9220_02234 [Synechococcus sp. MIT S9220]|nr:hypothetical protein SynMITS9220_02234 [Synechococcus sp. MIT S9220]
MSPTTTEWTLSLPPDTLRMQRSSWPSLLLLFSGSLSPLQG